MKKKKWILAAVILGILAITACIQALDQREKNIDQIYTVNHAADGGTLITWYEDGKNVIALADQNGRITRSVTASQSEKGLTHRIQAAVVSDDDMVYVLRDSLDEQTGAWIGEDLVVYDFTEILPSATVVGVENLQSPSAQEEYDTDWHYGWMNISGDVLSVIGINEEESLAARRVFEFGALSDRSVNIKSERYYPLAEDEGVYQAVGNGTDIAYVSKSGKVFHASETKVEEIYPARNVEVLMYPLYISFAESGYVYMQDGESGNILKLNLTDGEEEILKKGADGFGEGIEPAEICKMSMTDLNNFSAIAENGSAYSLCVMHNGEMKVFGSLKQSAAHFWLGALQVFAKEVLAVGVLLLLIWSIFRGIIQGRTIMGKLLLAALPLMILTMSVFGITVYHFYHDSVVESYEKQVMDEGNMMTALFGQESFDALEYPYDYVSDDYRYLAEQMDSRDLYSRVVYFEDGRLYTGVDEHMPCFYPTAIQVNTTLDQLYTRAALTGESQSATIEDGAGERIVSVTPVGGTAGRSVYLYETGIFTARMEAYQRSYIRNFVWICAVFLVVLAVLLTAAYMKILQPLSEIRQGMELFAGGERDIRIEPETKDELAGISRVFNKMADDIDLQILNLKNMSDIYYKFMPMSMIRMLKQDNLGNLGPGSCVKGTYAVLSVFLKGAAEGDVLLDRARERNRFFNLINEEAKKYNALPIVDNTSLSSMVMICPEGAESAVRTALSILANVDVYNGQEETENPLSIAFLLHTTSVSVVICGDEDQYIPVTVMPGMEKIMQEKEAFLELDTRLFITQEAMQEIHDQSGLGIRYIGALGVESYENGFYECYDDKDAENAHLRQITESNFRKAVKLYEEGYLYEAKNLFAMVLQDDPNDMIARYYIFRCK